MTDHHLFHHLFEADPRLDQVLARLITLTVNSETIMASLADITLAIQQQATVEQGVVALLHELSSELTAAIKAEDPAAVQGVLDLINANTKALSDAVLANTPAAIGSATLTTPVPTPVADVPPAPEPAPAPELAPEPAPPADTTPGTTTLVEPPSAPPHGETPTAA